LRLCTLASSMQFNLLRASVHSRLARVGLSETQGLVRRLRPHQSLLLRRRPPGVFLSSLPGVLVLLLSARFELFSTQTQRNKRTSSSPPSLLSSRETPHPSFSLHVGSESPQTPNLGQDPRNPCQPHHSLNPLFFLSYLFPPPEMTNYSLRALEFK
jgi:hypothetical protein